MRNMRFAIWLQALALFACTDAYLQARSTELDTVDDKLTLRGRVCASPATTTGFPVKVLFVIDQSGSMCVSDPPGSQPQSGFCQAAAAVPPGVTQPARVRALLRMLQAFSSAPNVEVGLVTFETNAKKIFPDPASPAIFGSPNDPQLTTDINLLQTQLGKGTDYQGAMAMMYTSVQADIELTKQMRPAELPRTRYVVVFLTDGTPFPRCAANDNLTQYADPDNPELIWSDSYGAGDFCNLIDPMDPDAITGFVAGTDRNQNYQLYAYVDQLVELKRFHNIGDIRLHTILLFNEEAVRICGLICQDLYGQYPNYTTAAGYPQAAKRIATYILRKLAERGNGVYQEFIDNNGIANMGLGALDYTSLASRNVMKQFMVKSLSSMPGPNSRELDTDGDGLKDELDNDFTDKTNNFFPDSDGDCFDDNFEAQRKDDGFVPSVKDGRGCDPASALTPGCRCADTDGDGLSQFAEGYLGTRETLFDSDGDGIGDGDEVRFGLDPTNPTASSLDTDGDGNPDSAELRADSSPVRADNRFFDKLGYQYETTPIENNNQVCYDFTVSNLTLVTPPKRAGLRQGFNLYKLTFGESPESGVATDYGVWKAACAWAQYDPPSIRVPVGPELTFNDGDFRPPEEIDEASEYATRCVGNAP
jgi:von Willebrand factor type A domain/Bacterial TSP3 repeat